MLLKPGALDADERKLIEAHAEIGYRILAGSGSELLDLAASIALTHHERYDGSGYPTCVLGTSLALVLVDCDDLKRVNDTQGHDRGDDTLRVLATLLREGKRGGDLAARIGGDEFGLALPAPTSRRRRSSPTECAAI